VFVTNSYIVKNLSDAPPKDFAPVAPVTRSHRIVVVHPHVPPKTRPERIALDKAGSWSWLRPARYPTSSGTLNAATRDPQVRELASKLGFERDSGGVGSPEQAAEFLKTQRALWAKTAQEPGIEAQ
jgi:tripartite-type tricarboxylate transporter receptor subunit TctC